MRLIDADKIKHKAETTGFFLVEADGSQIDVTSTVRNFIIGCLEEAETGRLECKFEKTGTAREEEPKCD